MLGENVMPESLTNDKFCEELRYPHFPTGKFGFQTKRKVMHYRNILISD